MSSPSESGDIDPSPARGTPIVAAVLGLNVWLIAVGIPAFALGLRSAWVAAGATAGAAALGVGLALRARARRASVACLLGLFPASVIATAGAIDRASEGQAYSTLGVTLGALGLLAFGAAATVATDDVGVTLLRGTRPLGAGTPLASDPKRVPRRVLLAIAAVGGFLVAVVAPMAGADYAASWPGTSRQSASFVAVVGGVLGIATVAGLVGGGLRATKTEGSLGRRVALAILVGLVLGLAAFALLRD